MSLYLWIDVLSISVPLLVSFHPRLKLYKSWQSLFLAIFLVGIPYIIWDVFFTQSGYWGFNETYLSGIYIFHLPIEEWLFFICIPYACIFTHLALTELYPSLKISTRSTRVVSIILLIGFHLILFFNFDHAYTATAMIFAMIALAVGNYLNKDLLSRFYITFLFMLIPFAIVNGILTGTGIENEVVWYNDLQNMGIRFATIPIEDSTYAFSLILLNLFLFDYFKRKKIPF